MLVPKFYIVMCCIPMLLSNAQQLFSQPPPSIERIRIPTELGRKIDQFQSLLREAKEKRVDISKAMELDVRSRGAVIAGDFDLASQLITEAIKLLIVENQAEMTRIEHERNIGLSSRQSDDVSTVGLEVASNEVIITNAVPRFSYGRDVTIFQGAFSSTILKAVDGKVNIQISSIPVILEDHFDKMDNRTNYDRSISQNSPFGGTPVSSLNFDDRYCDIGVKWIRYSGKTMAWDIIERTKSAYDWTISDRLIGETAGKDINIFITVRSFNRWDQPSLSFERGRFLKPKAPNNLSDFLKFLKASVERYNGQEKVSALVMPVINYWQIDNEVDGNFWGDTPESYARLLKASYNIIKKANYNAKVVIAGASSIEGFSRFYVPIFKELCRIADKPGERYLDVFDIHWYGNVGEYRKVQSHNFHYFIEMCHKTLADYGYANIPIWITETGTYGGKGVVGRSGEPLPEQDESAQAAELVKRYVYFIANGVEKIFWSQLVEEHHTDGIGSPNDYFENVGLIKNPETNGESSKKLAYYSYKLLSEKIEGSSWKDTKRIDFGRDVYAYRFLKNGKSIFVIWRDDSM